MKKLLLVASLCVAAIIVAPIASASAATVAGCVIEGKATFAGGTGEIETAPQELEYKFKATSGSCTAGGAFESAEAHGKGFLSCGVGAAGLGVGPFGAQGEGFLKIGTKEHKFKIVLVAAAGVVAFATIGDPLTEEILGGGVATFLTDSTSVNSCFVNGKASSLKFTLVAGGATEV